MTLLINGDEEWYVVANDGDPKKPCLLMVKLGKDPDETTPPRLRMERWFALGDDLVRPTRSSFQTVFATSIRRLC